MDNQPSRPGDGWRSPNEIGVVTHPPAVALLIATLPGVLAGCDDPPPTRDSTMSGLEHINPDELPKNPAFTQAVVVPADYKTIHIGGQNAINTDGKVVEASLSEQTLTALRHIELILESLGTDISAVVKWNVMVVAGNDASQGMTAFQEVWGSRSNPPAITLTYVVGLSHPDLLVEIDAIAAVLRKGCRE